MRILKLLRITKKTFYYSMLVIPMYLLIMVIISQVCIDNPELFFPSQVSANIINPFEDDDISDLQNYSKVFKQFESYVFIISGHSGHDLFLSATPGIHKSQIYRNFSIYIFSNMPCFYEIKIDDQLYSRGYCEFKATVPASSPYETLNVKIRLINETNMSLPLFEFSNLVLLDSPWELLEEGEEEGVLEPYIMMTEGEFTSWVIMRVLIDVSFAFLGVVFGTSYATLHADLRGVRQVI